MNNVADKLYNLIGTKFNNTDIKTLDAKGKETTNMEEIEMFSFDFLVDSRNYGPVVILLSAEENLEVYYGDNTSKSLERPAKKKWENLIEHLSTFARSNRLGFSLKHTTDLKYDLSNITDITESFRNIFEGYYGTSKTSYSPQGKAKIVIKHSKKIGEGDKRFRNISQIFIENADGERFKLPFKKLAGARAMARHVTEGGNPYDLFGIHISEMVNDINTLGGFVRRSKMYEGNDEAMGMVETGRTHYNSLRKGLKQISGVRGYKTFKENWEPSAITEMDTDTTAIRGMFMNKKVNQRTEDALPLLARLQKMVEANQPDIVTVTTEDIHGDFIREAYDNLGVTAYNKLISESPEITDILDFLAQYKSATPIPNEKYFYVSVMHTPLSESEIIINVGCFAKPHTLLEFHDNSYVFDINGTSKSYPKKQSRMQNTFIMKTAQEVNNITTAVSLKFNNVKPKIIETGDMQISEDTAPEYRGFKVKFSKVPGKKLAARALSRAGAFVAGAHGKNEAAAMEALKIEVDDYISGLERVTGKANINLNVEFTTNHLRAGEDQIWCKFEPGPLLVVAGEQELKNEDIVPGYLRGEGFTKTGNRKKMASETGHDLLGFGINPTIARESQAIANGRYTIADVTQDQHGNKVYSLDFDSVVTNTNEKISLGVPGLTVATQRGIGEASMDEGNALRPTEKETYVKIKDLNISALKGYARRIGLMSHYQINHDADEDMMIDEIMDFLYGDNWEQNLVTSGAFNEIDESNKPSAQRTYNDIKDWGITGLQGYAHRIGMTDDMIRGADAEMMMDEIMGFLYDDNWEQEVMDAGGFNEMDEITEFEQWADNIVEDTVNEGTWAVPETPDDLRALEEFLAEPQPLGIDGMNVTDALYDIIGDDELFDALGDAADDDADADARPYVIDWIENAIDNRERFPDPAVIRNLQKALDNAEVELPEGCSGDLDADDSTQLNASINKHVDQYAKSKKVTESVDLNDLMKLTNRLILRK